MSYRPHGRASVDPSNPSAWGVCDRCSFWYLLRDLRPEFQWAGLALISLHNRVCDGCYDEPAPFLKTIIIPPDPPPLYNTRPKAFAIDETDFRITEEQDLRITENDIPRVLDQSATET